MSEFYYSIADLPLDKWNESDEDNSVLSEGPPAILLPVDMERNLRALSSAELATTASRYVPFKRTIKLGTIGKDSFAVKRSIAKSGIGKWGEWGSVKSLFGPYSVKHLKTFQQRHGLHVDGVYGLNTHKKMAPFFDDYGVFLLGQVKLISPEEKKRNAIVAAAMLGYTHRASLHYTESSLRMQGVRNRIRPPHYPNYEDCSSFATWCYWVAGAADPNGLGYNGRGYTGTQVNHGRAVALGQAKPGDLVFYGWNRGIPTHVAIYVGHGRVVSNGSEIGPLLLSASYRTITEIRSYV